MMRILIDQDQVLASWVERVLEWYNHDQKKRGQKSDFTLEDVQNWDMTTNLGPESEDAIRSYMRYPDFYQDLDPVPGAVEGVKELLARGHDVVVASAVPKSAGIAYHGKLVWLRKHMPFFDLDDFVAIHRKDLLRGDVLFDDGVHNLEPCSREMLAVALDCPWNRGWRGVRVKDWPAFLDLIAKIEGDRAFVGELLARTKNA